jgi:hypothetical protein
VVVEVVLLVFLILLELEELAEAEMVLVHLLVLREL